MGMEKKIAGTHAWEFACGLFRFTLVEGAGRDRREKRAAADDPLGS